MESLPPQTQKPEQLEMFTDPSDGRVDYELLVGHDRTDGSFKSTEELQTEYVKLTDNIVNTAVDGIDVVNPETGEKEKKPVDYIVWLDKSARPISWLLKDLWPTLAKDKDGNVPDMPQSRFVNIDRNQWASDVDPDGSGFVDVDNIDKSVIRSLRSVFLSNPNDRKDGLVPSIDEAPTQFDGKTVLIVDEVRSSGRTLQYAERFFMRAFPKASIGGKYWMSEMATKNGAIGNADIPVWYSDETVLGRGIGNRNVDLSRKSTVRAQKLGAWFLSSRLKEKDSKADKLRLEMRQLAKDLKAGDVFYEPSLEREDEDYDERAVRINGTASFEDYLEKLKELKKNR